MENPNKRAQLFSSPVVQITSHLSEIRGLHKSNARRNSEKITKISWYILVHSKRKDCKLIKQHVHEEKREENYDERAIIKQAHNNT